MKGKHGKKSSRAIEIGSAAFSIATGKTAGVEVHLDATGRAFLASHRGQINATLQLVQGSESTRTSVHLTETKPDSKRKG